MEIEYSKTSSTYFANVLKSNYPNNTINQLNFNVERLNYDPTSLNVQDLSI